MLQIFNDDYTVAVAGSHKQQNDRSAEDNGGICGQIVLKLGLGLGLTAAE